VEDVVATDTGPVGRIAAMSKKYELTLEGITYQVEVEGEQVVVNGRPFNVTVEDNTVKVDGSAHTVELDGQQVIFDGIAHPFQAQKIGGEKEAAQGADGSFAAAEGAITAIMPGKIVRMLVAAGDEVGEGDVVCVLEAMKMENELQAPADGTVQAVHVSPGDDVEMGAVLIEIE
jgi:acetyl-CoA/propionyl-CoA carboxylase biotin carboxyl carrier protein